MTAPPTAKDWKCPQTDKEWKDFSRAARKRIGNLDQLPRDVRLLIYEYGELPQWLMRDIISRLRRGEVAVVIINERKHVLRPVP